MSPTPDAPTPPETPEGTDPTDAGPSGTYTRREALRRIGTGGLSVFGAGMVMGAVGTHAVAHVQPAGAADTEPGHNAAEQPTYGDGRLSSELPAGVDAGPYGGDFAVPDGLAADALDSITRPPAPRRGPQDIEMTVVEHPLRVAQGYELDAWTYNGTAPGPTIRATEGDLIRIRFSNATGHNHNLHFHGRHSPTQDGWEPVPPGREVVYEIEAGPAGVHPYHCHTMPIDRHIARGLYGVLIVDPAEGRSDAHEVVLALSGWDPDDDGRNEVYSWNGVAGFYDKYPIKIGVGEPVRAYVLNMVEFDPITSFHLHAQTFDVYPAGTGVRPAFHSDIITLGQMERAMLEFTLPELGRYMFHPHQHSIAARGAMGWFAAV